MRFEFFVATRYLRAKRRQAVIGVITGISIAGVAAGVASLIVALSINNGFRQDLQDRLLGSTSHINLLRIESDGIKGWRTLMDRLSKTPHVVATAPAVYEQVLISRGARARGAVLKGMIPAYERKVSDLLKSVNIGSADALEEPPAAPPGETAAGREPSAESSTSESQDSMRAVANRLAAMPPIILGKDMAENLGATVGSVVLVTSPQGELTPFGMVPKYNRFRVAGIFNSGFYDYDSSWAFARLSDTQRLFGIGDQVSVIEFKLDDIYQAGQVSQELEKAAGPGFMANNWMEQNKAIFRALRLERLVTFITIGLIVFVAALNILIALTMMVMEKTRDIAVLMSMGTRKSQVRRVFIAQGVLIGLIGTTIGLIVFVAALNILIALTMMVMEKTRDIAVLMSMGTRKSQVRRVFIAQGVLIGLIGTAIGLILGYLLAWAGGHYRFLSLSPEVYSIDYVPFVPRALDGVLVAAIAVGISFIATVYPSWAAARILPAEALRYE